MLNNNLVGKDAADDVEGAVLWLEQTLPHAVKRLLGTDDLDMPILQLPIAQLRIAHALYSEDASAAPVGETMGRLSEKLGVRVNALTQAANRLVKHKLAERLPDAKDRRVVRLRLTELGAQCIAQRRMHRRESLCGVYGILRPEERLEFLNAVRTLEAAVHRMEDIEAGTQIYSRLPGRMGEVQPPKLVVDGCECNSHQEEK